MGEYEYDEIDGFKTRFYRDLANELDEFPEDCPDSKFKTVVDDLEAFEEMALQAYPGFYRAMEAYEESLDGWNSLFMLPNDRKEQFQDNLPGETIGNSVLYGEEDHWRLRIRQFTAMYRDDIIEAGSRRDLQERIEDSEKEWRPSKEDTTADAVYRGLWAAINAGDPSVKTIASEQYRAYDALLASRDELQEQLRERIWEDLLEREGQTMEDVLETFGTAGPDHAS